MNELRKIGYDAIRDQVPLLFVAAAIVGIAISMDGDGRKVVNGVGGVIWIVAAFRIFMNSLTSRITNRQFILVLAVILVLSWLIRPSDPLWAAIGFGWGGILVGWVGKEIGSKLGALLGALWLPAHLLIAVLRALIRRMQDEPSVLRSDPPPTAVLVPLVVVVCAWGFAKLASDWHLEKDTKGLLRPRSPISPGK